MTPPPNPSVVVALDDHLAQEASDLTDTPDSPETSPKVLPTVLDNWEPTLFNFPLPTSTPSRFNVSVDLDSFYFMASSMEHIAVSLGPNAVWNMPSLTNRETASYGHGRLGVDCTELGDDSPFVGSYQKDKVFPLSQFPNVRIAICCVDNIIGVNVYINLYYMGSKTCKEKSRFTNDQLAVVNAALNIARIKVSNFSDGEGWSAARRLYPFKSAAGGALDNIGICRENNILKGSSMVEFGREFDKALTLIAEDDRTYDFEAPIWSGMAFISERDRSIPRSSMVKFAKKLKQGLYFNASAAGVKAQFADPKHLTFDMPSVVPGDPSFVPDNGCPINPELSMEQFNIVNEEIQKRVDLIYQRVFKGLSIDIRDLETYQTM